MRACVRTYLCMNAFECDVLMNLCVCVCVDLRSSGMARGREVIGGTRMHESPQRHLVCTGVVRSVSEFRRDRARVLIYPFLCAPACVCMRVWLCLSVRSRFVGVWFWYRPLHRLPLRQLTLAKLGGRGTQNEPHVTRIGPRSRAPLPGPT